MTTAATYRIETDFHRNHLRIIASGHLDAATQIALEADLRAGFHRLEAAGNMNGSHLTLLDVREQGVLSREIASRFQANAERHGAFSRRLAILVSGSALQKIQARRIAGSDSVRVFVCEAEATTWLFTEPPE